MRFRTRREAEIGCMAVARVLQAYLDGEVNRRTAQWVSDHLRVCRRCGMKADTYRAIKSSLARTGGIDEITRRRLVEFSHHIAGQPPEG